MWGWTWIEQLMQDLRYAARTMLKNPAFTAMAALSLALGIGANTAIFSFMDALMLRGLPVGDPERLVTLNWQASISRMRGSVLHSGSGSAWKDGAGMRSGMFPYPSFDVLRKADVFSNVFGYFSMRSANFYARGAAEATTGELVTGGYFRGLELVPAAGRFLVEDDDRAGAAGVEDRSGDRTAVGMNWLTRSPVPDLVRVLLILTFDIDRRYYKLRWPSPRNSCKEPSTFCFSGRWNYSRCTVWALPTGSNR